MPESPGPMGQSIDDDVQLWFPPRLDLMRQIIHFPGVLEEFSPSSGFDAPQGSIRPCVWNDQKVVGPKILLMFESCS